MEIPRTVSMDPDLCSGCGNCDQIAPSVFRQSDLLGVSVVHVDGEDCFEDGISTRELDPSEFDDALRAAKECPGEIIVVD